LIGRQPKRDCQYDGLKINNALEDVICLHPADILNDLNIIQCSLLELKKLGCLLLEWLV
jgi:hypothetical protein